MAHFVVIAVSGLAGAVRGGRQWFDHWIIWHFFDWLMGSGGVSPRQIERYLLFNENNPREGNNLKSIFISALILMATAVITPYTAQAATIYACELKAIGTIRIVNSTSSCTKYEYPISWDAAGAAGPTGPQGPQGLQGPPGPAGTALAYAHVLADGTIDTAQSSANIVVHRHYSIVDGSVDAGLYCIGVLGGTDGMVHAAVVSLDSKANVGGTVQASVFLASGCEGTGATFNNNIYVVTRPQLQDGGQNGIDRAFYLIVN